MTPTLLVVLLLAQAEAPDNPPAGALETPESASLAETWRYLARVDASGLALLPRAGVGAEEDFVQVEPTLILDGGEELGVNLGAPVRLRLGRGGEGAGLVRRADWDSLSDWGQLVRGLKPLRLEVRRQHGGFRQGSFGPDYELARFKAAGPGQPGARYLGGAELRWRLFGGRLYALGTGGTLLFPESMGSLKPGACASVGLGVDNAR